MALLKDLYSPVFYSLIAENLSQVIPQFDKARFIKMIYSPEFEYMELKERMRHTTIVMHEFMPQDFKKCAEIIKALIETLRINGIGDGRLEMIFLPDYVQVYGIDDYETSINSLEFITQYITCEFAVRPFLIKYGSQMIEQMILWSTHKNAQVRRLSTEGSRPRLPWAMAVPSLKKDPYQIMQILENLKGDVSESVRRSVANNLNDIAKDHPDMVVKIANNWKGLSKETDAIIRHGCRTLLKRGHAEILRQYGLDNDGIIAQDLTITTPQVSIGGDLVFSFEVGNQNSTAKLIRLEYAVHFKKANGQLTKKVFKISEKPYQSGEKLSIRRKQSFRIITTRRYYLGEHAVSVIVNGEEKMSKTFVLTD